MAHLEVEGTYELGNFKSVTCTENQSEQQANGTAGSGWNRGIRGRIKKGNKLEFAIVTEIYLANGSQSDVGLAFGVDQSVVSHIKRKKL